MGYCFYLGILILFVTGCASTPNGNNLPKFSYIDGLSTAKTVRCSSRKALDCMACALQGEAANQPANGVYAVGVTIMTRAEGRPNKVCRVTKARGQFEGMKKQGQRKISKKIWKLASHIIESKETGWTHFYAPRAQTNLNRNKPSWAHSFEKRKCSSKKIGDHIFYNQNKCQFDKYFRVNAQND